jgi:predicted aspartyl protease
MRRARSIDAFRGALASALLIALTTSAWADSRNARAAHASLRLDAATHQSDVTHAKRAHAIRQTSSSHRIARSPSTSTRTSAQRIPALARFSEVEGRGLVVKAWINDEGPFDFVIDTGAGSTILSTRVAQAARVAIASNSTVNLSGLSGTRGAAHEASVRSIAMGESRNYLPGRGSIIVADSLPTDIDGVLDPSETFYPLGYVIDFYAEALRAFNPHVEPLTHNDVTAGGDVVEWLTDGATRRPFVSLEGGRRALIDTGSGLGLGFTPEAARALGILGARGRGREGDVRDLGRGRVGASRIAPATVRIGALVLRGVPTDLLNGASDAAPIILGRDALRPFALTFDPVSRLIRFAPR